MQPTCPAPLLPPLQFWLGGGGGNANFVYGMNLLWGGLQVLLLLRLLRGAARAEARPSDASTGTDAVGGGQQEGGAGGAAGNADERKAD